jgi:hypothetical protein
MMRKTLLALTILGNLYATQAQESDTFATSQAIINHLQETCETKNLTKNNGKKWSVDIGPITVGDSIKYNYAILGYLEKNDGNKRYSLGLVHVANPFTTEPNILKFFYDGLETNQDPDGVPESRTFIDCGYKEGIKYTLGRGTGDIKDTFGEDKIKPIQGKEAELFYLIENEYMKKFGLSSGK